MDKRELQVEAHCWVLWAYQRVYLVLIEHTDLQCGTTAMPYRYCLRYSPAEGM